MKRWVIFCNFTSGRESRPHGWYNDPVRRKRPLTSAVAATEVPLIPEALIEEAKRAIESDRLKKPARCSVCGEDCAPNSTEGLCWVCRRLKLSAWRDSDAQLPVQE
jgi:hypothetical protein